MNDVKFIKIITSLILLISTQTLYSQENLQEQNFNTLNAYQDILEQTSQFSFAFLRYRHRGYNNKLTPLSWNGTPLINWQNQTNSWNILGNLTSLSETIPNKTALTTSFDYWQSGGRLSAAISNRTYLYRAGARYITKGKWNIAADISKRSGESLSIQAVSTDDYSFFLAINKSIGHHNLTLSLLYAPSNRTTQPATTQEAYEITGNNLYNPAWGYQSGRQRSARTNTSRQPIAILEHNVNLTDKISLTSSLSARVGEEIYTTLMWQNAPNPYPDYYRYLPSFQKDSAARDLVNKRWHDDESMQRINYQNMYNVNGYNTPISSYIFENRVRKVEYYRVATALKTKFLSAGADVVYAVNRNFKTVADLMGGDYWLDIDAYVEQDDDVKEQVQSNLRNPDFRAKVGDTFGYDYAMSMVRLGAWVTARKTIGQYGGEVTLATSSTQYQREGFFEKENFDGNQSYGKSSRIINYDYSVDLSGWYTIGGRFRAQVNFGYSTMSPSPSNIFISPEYRNATVDRVENSKVLKFEVAANYRIESTKIRGALYYTTVKDDSRLLSFYDDNIHTYTNYWMQKIDERYMGLEFAAEFELYYNLTLGMAIMLSDNRYTSNPVARQWKESTGALLCDEESVFYDNLHIASSPQCVGVVSFRYAPRGYSVELSANGFDNNYVALSPLRRTVRGQSISSQEKLTAGMTLDLQVSKTFSFDRGGFLGFYLGVNNLFNNRFIRSSGYESYRTSANGSAASKYYYGLGINGYLSVVYRF